MVTLLGIPGVVKTRSRLKATGEEALCILLYRLVNPGSWAAAQYVFLRDKRELSEIALHMVREIWKEHRWRLRLKKSTDFVLSRMDWYVAAVQKKTGVTLPVWAFIDGTARRIGRPDNEHQQACCSGHKRMHAIKFQGLTTPDGIVVDWYGPVAVSYTHLTLPTKA